MYRFEEDFFFFPVEKKTKQKKLQIFIKMRLKKGKEWRQAKMLFQRENVWELESVLGLDLWIYKYIYIEILHIFYIYFFCQSVWGRAMCVSPTTGGDLTTEALLALWLASAEFSVGTHRPWNYTEQMKDREQWMEDRPNQTTDKSILI